MIRLAFDIGGTFTDLVLQDTDTQRVVAHKIPTTPGDLRHAVMAGLAQLMERAEALPGSVGSVFHATTIATNAVLERKGVRAGVLTTRGFRDVVLLGRQKRYDTYDMYMDKPAPLTRRRFVFEVDERLGFDGAVVDPLDMESVDAAAASLVEADIESVAVCLIHAYANGAHEEAIAKRLSEQAPGISVSLSSRVSAKIREYERVSTTLANAYVKPIVGRYLNDLETSLKEAGFTPDLFVMQSNGGLVSTALAKEYPVRIIESGPAAGVLMCGVVGREEGFDHVLTFDMGGTTAKIGAIDEGVPAITTTFEVDAVAYRRYSGLPLNIPAVELLEIGAGGGSIARTDTGLIEVGPQSAGADPGPMCYGAGGSQPTVTDANLVLGYLNPDYFNGGAMRLDVDAAAAGITDAIAGPLDLTLGEAAWGVHAIANSNMERAMRVVSVERGRDPRNYALVAFGGAGPLHAARLARALDIPKFIVPFGAGVGSAIGLLDADPRIDVSVTRIFRLTADGHLRIGEVYDELLARAADDVSHLAAGTAPVWTRYAFMRYVGQGFEIKVDLPDGPIEAGYVERTALAFHDAYERNYGYRDEEAEIEAVDWTLVATIPAGNTAVASGTDESDQAAEETTRQAYFPELGGFAECAVINRYAMTSSQTVSGPAIIEEREATTVILPGDQAVLSSHGHLIVSIGKDGG
jgi:N-methylhydantoinase A